MQINNICFKDMIIHLALKVATVIQKLRQIYPQGVKKLIMYVIG